MVERLEREIMNRPRVFPLRGERGGNGNAPPRTLLRMASGDPQALIGLLSEVVRSNRSDRDGLIRCYGLCDRKAVARFAHRLKGGARVVGDLGLANACLALERAALGAGRMEAAYEVVILELERLERILLAAHERLAESSSVSIPA
ncbi:Hpt domain-containing protein [Metapseudomonas otitidis]|uniref:Hpt domain-containing protein n=1 Tax=Metapseudomonas otitidis TaxID=319939 RepID=UPI00155445F7|nr:Hpt domain-containing protein [Pseudomonas otitidis]